MDRTDRNKYFRRPSYLTRIISLLCTFVLFASWYQPSWFAIQYLGVVGRFFYTLGSTHNTMVGLANLALWIIHGFESAYAVHLCKVKNIEDSEIVLKWAIQTFIFGVFSLRLIRSYEPPPKEI